MSFEDIANRMAARDGIDPTALSESASRGFSVLTLILGLIVAGAGIAVVVVTLAASSEVSYLGSFLITAGTAIVTNAFRPAAESFGEELGRSLAERRKK